MSRFPVYVFTLALLAGCANIPPPYHGKDYSSLPPERMNVSAVLIDNEYMAPNAAPNVDHQLTPPMTDILSTAINAHYPRLMTARNAPIELRFAIKDASITETALPLPENWFDRMTNDKPEYHYDGHLVVEALATGHNTRRSAFAKAEVSRSLDLGRMSAAERSRQVQGMAEQLVDEAMDQLDQQINDNFGSLVYGDGVRDETITPQPSGRWDKMRSWK